jgi:hypothetical protein
MEVFPGTLLHRMSDRVPAEQLTLFEPLASAINWVDIVGVDEGDTVVIEGPGHQGLAMLEAVLARKPALVIGTVSMSMAMGWPPRSPPRPSGRWPIHARSGGFSTGWTRSAILGALH